MSNELLISEKSENIIIQLSDYLNLDRNLMPSSEMISAVVTDMPNLISKTNNSSDDKILKLCIASYYGGAVLVYDNP